MFVIERARQEVDGIQEETLDIAGTTGNIYTIKIARQPTCTCPDGHNGLGQCKHIIYVCMAGAIFGKAC